MKWLIISDVHGYYAELCMILDREKEIKDVIFLGDGLDDIDRARLEYPDHNFTCVKGNCDIRRSEPTMNILTLDGYKVLITHGDGFDVKSSKLGLRRAAIGLGVDIALYGHTHRARWMQLGSIGILNPGSIGDRLHPTYAVVETTGNGAFSCHIYDLED